MHTVILLLGLQLLTSIDADSYYHGQHLLERVPHFTATPSNSSYREGSAVKLTCEATGKPQPLISWYFNGDQIIPTRKYSFNDDSSILTIYPYQQSDIGKYTCLASNKNGQVQHSFDLGIINSSTPLIIDSPLSKTVSPGQLVTFVCRASGQPPPKITWMFEGNQLDSSDPHITLTQFDTELTIRHATREDEGIYICRASNAIGSAMAEATLKVHLPQQEVLDQSLTKDLLRTIVQQARHNVDRAINESKASFHHEITSPWEFMKQFKFNIPQNVELTKAREIYEQSLLLVQEHVRNGLNFPINELPTNFSFESVLAVSHIQTIMELSGCVTGPFRNPCTDMCLYSKYRSYDGQCNNMEHPFWGVAQTPFRRNLPPIYENGFNTPVGWDPEKLYFGFKKPNPRSVSLKLISTETITPHHGYTAMMKQWGQFVAHDIEQTAPGLARQTYMKGAICNKTCENLDPCYNVPMPPEDPRLHSEHKPKIKCIEVERSSATCGSGQTGPIYRQLTYREQMNILTSYIDGSGIYGSSEVDALDLRDLFGDHGLLRFDIVSSSQKPYLPFERESAMECRRNRSRENPISCFLAGDYRANEQLTSYIDGSGIYGSSEVDALDLRDLFGDHGLLRFDIVSSSQKPYLPFERESAMECRRNRSRENPISCFLAGDYRANEQLTSYIDGSGIYGSSEVDALDLRDLFGDHGLLRFDIVSSSQKPYLPFERESAMECRRNRSRENPISCFLAGDYRANEQLALLSMHTLWLREHNRIATKFLEINPHWDGETIYQETRKIIGAMLQVITFEHWLPKVLGPDGYAQLIGPYTGYDPEVNPTLANSFSAGAFRFGHTIVNPILYRLGNDFKPIKEGNIPLHEAFFAPERLLSEGGIDPLLRGLFGAPMKTPKEEQLVNKELTHKLFSRVEESMYDLATINIQRGRDHALPGYIEFRRWCNLTVPKTWEDLAADIPDVTVRQKLEELYGHPGNIDLWVGGISERRLAGALVGPTIACILGDQFRRLRTGDRFWYENEGVFTKLQLQQIRKTSLAAVLCNSGDDIDRVQEDVFEYKGDRPMSFYKSCDKIPQINLNVWQACCEKTCTSSTGDSHNAHNRKRRAQLLYKESFCDAGGVIRKDGDEWSVDECTTCKCTGGQIWCSVTKGCKQSKKISS
ncbi:Peroxidasin -like protein [Toxocara canis]|uniref:Peroxidasin-like protein n=1 Tax=Toxocara canis TaxID=6265 RepID=A0A0B2VCH9_TOXCA|nr:Peroxidasin -like protein [Toxocara canis]